MIKSVNEERHRLVWLDFVSSSCRPCENNIYRFRLINERLRRNVQCVHYKSLDATSHDVHCSLKNSEMNLKLFSSDFINFPPSLKQQTVGEFARLELIAYTLLYKESAALIHDPSSGSSLDKVDSTTQCPMFDIILGRNGRQRQTLIISAWCQLLSRWSLSKTNYVPNWEKFENILI